MASEVPTPPQRLVIAWLDSLGKISTKRLADDPLPQWLIRCAAGVNFPEVGYIVATVSVHSIGGSAQSAHDSAWDADDRMAELALNPLSEITLAGGIVACVDYSRNILIPTEISTSPHMTEYVARYEIGSSYTSV